MALSDADAAAWGSDTDPGGLGWLRSLCGWHIAPRRTEYVYPRDVHKRALILPTLNLQGLVSLEMDGALLDLEELGGDGLPRVQWAEDGRVWWPGIWSSRFRGIRAQIDHGYTEVPEELPALVRRLAGVLAGGVASVRVGNISVTPSSVSANTEGLEPHVQAILSRYRLPSLS